jgi:hypothetical protein
LQNEDINRLEQLRLTMENEKLKLQGKINEKDEQLLK